MSGNRTADLAQASFPVDAAVRAAAQRAGVPGLLLCLRCGADHLDPAYASDRTMRATGDGWICAPGYGCAEDEGKVDVVVDAATGSSPRPSTCAAGAVDVDVVVRLIVGDERLVEISGEVTLVPLEYDGRPTSWGSPDHWVSGDLLADIYALCTREDLRDVLRAIESAAASVVPMVGGRIDPAILSEDDSAIDEE